jgi:hypothetical protein
MEEKKIQTIFNMIWNIEDLDDIGKLAAQMVFPSN